MLDIRHQPPGLRQPFSHVAQGGAPDMTRHVGAVLGPAPIAPAPVHPVHNFGFGSGANTINRLAIVYHQVHELRHWAAEPSARIAVDNPVAVGVIDDAEEILARVHNLADAGSAAWV